MKRAVIFSGGAFEKPDWVTLPKDAMILCADSGLRHARAREELADCFPEFAPYQGSCRFQDCAHVCEKGCGVLAAVQDGSIAESRHASYVAMYEIAKKRKDWEQ